MAREKYNLYYTLNQNIPKRKMTSKEEAFLIENSKELDENQAEVILLLMTEHFLIQNPTEKPKIPYSGKEQKGSTVFKIVDLPLDLKWILHKFFKSVLKIE